MIATGDVGNLSFYFDDKKYSVNSSGSLLPDDDFDVRIVMAPLAALMNLCYGTCS